METDRFDCKQVWLDEHGEFVPCERRLDWVGEPYNWGAGLHRVCKDCRNRLRLCQRQPPLPSGPDSVACWEFEWKGTKYIAAIEHARAARVDGGK
jgi:hypothetical protein